MLVLLTAEMYEVCRWDGLMSHDIPEMIHKIGSGIQKLWGYTYRHTDRKVSHKLTFILFNFQNKDSRLKYTTAYFNMHLRNLYNGGGGAQIRL
jgi:hypothetical protein